MADKKNAETAEVEATPLVEDAPATPVAATPKYDFTKLNTLAVVSLATAVSGFGAVAGVITGHVALAQIRQTGAKGRGLALAGVIVGYVGVAFAIFGGIARILGALAGPRYGISLNGGQRFNDQFGGGMMGGWDDQNGDQRGGPDNGFVNPGNGQGGGMMGGWSVQPGQQPSATPQLQSN